MDPGRHVLIKFATHPPKTYPELRAFIEKERPDWLQALMPRRINAPSDYWPQKVLALATIQAVISNQLMKDAGMKLDPTFGVVEGQTGHLLQFDVPTFTSPRSCWLSPPERIYRLTYLWMRFHFLSPHQFLCCRKPRFVILRKANALTSLSHGFKRDRSFRFRSRISPLQQPPRRTL